MIPTLPQHKTYFSLDEVCQWVDITPEALCYWLSAHHGTPLGSKTALPAKRRYHRREVLWLCKIKPSIEQMTENLVGKPVDLSPVREELRSVLALLTASRCNTLMPPLF